MLDSAREREVELVRRLKAGENSAVEEAAVHYLDRLRRFASRSVSVWSYDPETDANDAAVDGFVRALRRIATYDPAGPAAFFTYLCTNVDGRAKDLRRKNRRERSVIADDELVEENGGSTRADPGVPPEAFEMVELMTKSLSQRARDMMVAKYIDRLTYRELADKFHCSEDACKNMIFKAKQKLRKLRALALPPGATASAQISHQLGADFNAP